MLWDHKFINASNYKLNRTFVEPVTIKRIENEFIHAKADPRDVRLF